MLNIPWFPAYLINDCLSLLCLKGNLTHIKFQVILSFPLNYNFIIYVSILYHINHYANNFFHVLVGCISFLSSSIFLSKKSYDCYISWILSCLRISSVASIHKRKLEILTDHTSVTSEKQRYMKICKARLILPLFWQGAFGFLYQQLKPNS